MNCGQRRVSLIEQFHNGTVIDIKNVCQQLGLTYTTKSDAKKLIKERLNIPNKNMCISDEGCNRVVSKIEGASEETLSLFCDVHKCNDVKKNVDVVHPTTTMPTKKRVTTKKQPSAVSKKQTKYKVPRTKKKKVEQPSFLSLSPVVSLLPIVFSEEQELIAQSTLSGYNVAVDAVAGSGKTTTIQRIVSLNDKKSIQVLSYNKNLCIDTKQRLINYPKVKVNTIHSACGRLYGGKCNNDTLLSLMRKKVLQRPETIDLLIVDEAQDLYPILYDMIRKIMLDTDTKQVVVLGDRNQCVNTFTGSTKEYLVNAETYFHIDNGMWKSLTLKTSYRLTLSMARFVNEGMLMMDRIHVPEINDSNCSKHNVKVDFVVLGNVYNKKDKGEITVMVNNYLKEYCDGDPTKMAILAPTIKKASPVAELCNFLTQKGYPIYMKDIDKGYVDGEDTGKITVSTINSFKGREKDLIILFGFDGSYEKYFKRTLLEECDDVLYVAATRAKKKLVIIHSNDNGSLSFFNYNILYNEQIVSMIGGNIDVPKERSFNNNRQYGVLELCKYLPFDAIQTIMSLIKEDIIQHPKKTQTLPISETFKFRDIYIKENVSHLIGIIIPMLYCDSEFKFLKLRCRSYISECNIQRSARPEERAPWYTVCNKYHSLIAQYLEKHTHQISLSNAGLLCNFIDAVTRYVIFPFEQINNYSFLTENTHNIEQCVVNLHEMKPKYDDDEHEVSVSVELEDTMGNTVRICGDIDCLSPSNNTIYEFKVVGELTVEHKLQLAIYGILYNMDCKKKMKLMLLNAKTEEIIQLDIGDNGALILQILLAQKGHIIN